MADALAVATYLNIFVRNCSWVQMANLAQMVNAIAPVVTTPEVAVVQPIYYPLLMHSQAALDLAVDVHVDGPTVAAPDPPPVGRWAHRLGDLGPFDIVDASATVDLADQKVAVTLVNRSESQEKTEIQLRGHLFGAVVRARTITSAPEPGPLGLDAVNMEDFTVTAHGNALVVDLPAKSFTLLEARMDS